jgi:hypothetical protein
MELRPKLQGLVLQNRRSKFKLFLSMNINSNPTNTPSNPQTNNTNELNSNSKASGTSATNATTSTKGASNLLAEIVGVISSMKAMDQQFSTQLSNCLTKVSNLQAACSSLLTNVSNSAANASSTSSNVSITLNPSSSSKTTEQYFMLLKALSVPLSKTLPSKAAAAPYVTVSGQPLPGGFQNPLSYTLKYTPSGQNSINFSWSGPYKNVNGYGVPQSITIQCTAATASSCATNLSNTLQQFGNKAQQISTLSSQLTTQMNNLMKAMNQNVQLQTTLLNALAQALG